MHRHVKPRQGKRPKPGEISHSEALRVALSYIMDATSDLQGAKPLVAVDLSPTDSGRHRLVLGVEGDLATLDAIIDNLRKYYSKKDFSGARLSDIRFARDSGWQGDNYKPTKS